MALGHMYASQEQWGDRHSVRSAVFQLERMRMVTAMMRQEGDTGAVDPPPPLEELSRAYQRTGKTHEARPVTETAAKGYERIGRPADAARLREGIDGYR